MSLEMEATKAAEVALPVEPGSSIRSRIPYAAGYLAGARRPVTDEEVDAAARAINPEAWRAYDHPDAENAEEIVYRSRVQARAALAAARAVR